jgi:hypothetical protein
LLDYIAYFHVSHNIFLKDFDSVVLLLSTFVHDLLLLVKKPFKPLVVQLTVSQSVSLIPDVILTSADVFTNGLFLFICLGHLVLKFFFMSRVFDHDVIFVSSLLRTTSWIRLILTVLGLSCERTASLNMLRCLRLDLVHSFFNFSGFQVSLLLKLANLVADLCIDIVFERVKVSSVVLFD